ncbi:MAG TPA: hypothetical protein HPP58_06210 [Deltaproteobacteria bacterium]|nr:hypothetical protein [Deltaproteobacteria bacterium]
MADSWGPRKTVSIFFILAGVGSILMGVATLSFVASFLIRETLPADNTA